MTPALTRKIAAMKAAPKAPAPVFTIEQLRVIHQLAHEAAKLEIAAAAHRMAQPTQRRRWCG